MAFQMRQSKFRHVFGKPYKKDQGYDNIRITRSSADRPFCVVNPKYLAIATEAGGGSAFLVLPLSKTGRVERDAPVVDGHSSAVLDLAFSPHNDNVIASCSEDTTVKVWLIPEEGVVRDSLTDPLQTLLKHQKKVMFVLWHPTAQNVLLSAGADNKVLIWNAGTAELYVEIEMPDIIQGVSFNYNGSKLATTCKDKYLRIINPRNGEILQEGKGHDGSKPAQVAYLKGGKVFSTGFSRMSERQYALWDENDLSKSIIMNEIDNSNGVMFPFYDPDTSIVYTCGKGDSQIRYFEVTEEAPYVHYLSMYQSNNPQRGIGFMPKRGVDVNVCEIARLYKLHPTGFCEVIPMIVPRKSEIFQEDLYPDTAGMTAAVTGEEWIDNEIDRDPPLISMKTGFLGETVKTTAKVAARKSNVLDKAPVDKLAAAKPVDKLAAKTPVEDKLAQATPQKQREPVQKIETPKPKPVIEEKKPTPKPAPEPTPAPAATASRYSAPEKKSVDPPSEPQSALPPSETPEIEEDAEGTDTVDSVPSSNEPNFNATELMETVKALRERVENNEQQIEQLKQRVADLESEKKRNEEAAPEDD